MSGQAHLFSSGMLGDLATPNRIVMAPMTRARASEDGVPTAIMLNYYKQRAEAGLIITEGTVISAEATGFSHVPGIFTDEQVASWRPIVQAVHAEHGRIFLQLWHVGRISNPALLGGRLPVGPSAIDAGFDAHAKHGKVPTVTPREMTRSDIDRTIQDFRQAAINAAASGFDGVEIHAANGYLIHQFLVPSANRRVDDYGGSATKRARFLLDTVNAVAGVIGSGRVGVRLNPCMNGVAGIDLDDSAKQSFDYAIGQLNERGLAYLHLTSLAFGREPESANRTIAMAGRYRPLFQGPLIINSAMTSDAAEEAISYGLADFVAFGAPFIANPDLVTRFRERLSLSDPLEGTLYGAGSKGYADYPTAAQAAGRA